MKTNTEPGHCTSILLCAGANDSNLYEAHGLAGFGSGSDARPASWCAVLRIIHNLPLSTVKPQSL